MSDSPSDRTDAKLDEREQLRALIREVRDLTRELRAAIEDTTDRDDDDGEAWKNSD